MGESDSEDVGSGGVCTHDVVLPHMSSQVGCGSTFSPRSVFHTSVTCIVVMNIPLE